MIMPSSLVTGVGSGLGKRFHESFPGYGLTRENVSELLPEFRTGVDVIIHCAFQTAHQISNAGLDVAIKENLGLLGELLKIPHRKFVFISTLDVYGKGDLEHLETENLTSTENQDTYPKVKLLAEQMIQRSSPGALILRPGSLLGRYSRRGNLVRLIQDDEPELSLTPDSQLNIVLHEDVLEYVRRALALDASGIYNLVTSSNVEVAEIARQLGKRPRYGEFRYDVGKVSNAKARKIMPELARSSLDSIIEFVSRHSS